MRHTHDGRAAGERRRAASGESAAPALSRYTGWAVAAARGGHRPGGRRSDTSFGVGGKVITDFVGEEYATAVALQPDGKIVAVGLANDPSIGSAGFALARYLPNGTLDTTFGGDGRVITDFGGYTLANAVALQPDGKIVVAGNMPLTPQLVFIPALPWRELSAERQPGYDLRRRWPGNHGRSGRCHNLCCCVATGRQNCRGRSGRWIP